MGKPLILKKHQKLVQAILATVNDFNSQNKYFNFLKEIEVAIEDDQSIILAFNELAGNQEALATLVSGLENSSEQRSALVIKNRKQNALLTSNLIAFPIVYVVNNDLKKEQQSVDFSIDLIDTEKLVNYAKKMNIIGKNEKLVILNQLYSTEDLTALTFGDVFKINGDLLDLFLDTRSNRLNKYKILTAEAPITVDPQVSALGVRFLVASLLSVTTDDSEDKGSLLFNLISNSSEPSEVGLNKIVNYLDKVQNEVYSTFPLLKAGNNQVILVPPEIFSNALRSGFGVLQNIQLSHILEMCSDVKNLKIVFEIGDSLSLNFFVKNQKIAESIGYVYNATSFRLELKTEELIAFLSEQEFEIVEHTSQTITFKRRTQHDQFLNMVVH
jgi:hypothetical protein